MTSFVDGDRRELEKKAKAEGRLPPGQSLTLKWPVLHYGSVPHFDVAKWDFKISGLVEEPVRLTWREFRALPQTEVTSDFHCVTRWSRLDNRWKGVLFTDVLKLVGKARGAVRAGAGGRRLHGKCAAGGFIEAECVVCVRARWRAADRGAWRAIEADCAASVRVEEREMGTRIHIAGPRPAGVLGAEWLSRVRRSVERAAVFRKLEDCALCAEKF